MGILMALDLCWNRAQVRSLVFQKGQSPVKSVQKGPVLRSVDERASDRDSVFLRFLFLLSVFCEGRNTKEGEAGRSIGLIV